MTLRHEGSLLTFTTKCSPNGVSAGIETTARETVNRKNALENELTQVFILHHFSEPLADVGGIDPHALCFHIRRLEADLLQHLLQNRVKPACADVLGAAVHIE